MDYTDLKRGDVIVMGINPKYSDDSNERIIIIDKIKSNVVFKYMIYTYAELDISTIGVNGLFLEKEEPGYSYKVDDEAIDYYTFRLATVEEKTKLYNNIGKYFTENYDKDWYNHFTDSSYFDIQDFLLDMFCIKVEEYDNDLMYPEFVDNIHTYIWKRLCESLGCKEYDGDEFVEQLVNKWEFIDKVCKYLENINTDTYMDSGVFQMCDLIKDLRKKLEE